MKARQFALSLLLVLPAVGQPAPLPSAPPAPSARYVLANGTIHTALEEPFAGFIVVEDGKVSRIGRGDAPAEAVVDLGGGHLYPGLIDCDTQLGLVETESLRATRDEAEVGEVNPNLRAAVGFRAESVGIPVARSQGVMVAGVNPVGNLIAGQGSVMKLWGWTWEEMTLAPSWAMTVDWPSMSLPVAKDGDAEDKALVNLGKALFQLDDAFAEARAYQKDDGDVKWQALKPSASGQQPVLVRADGKSEIEAALAWSDRQKVRIVLVCGRDVHLFASQLAARQIPVVYATLNSPYLRPEESASLFYRTPGILREAGVLVALSPSGLGFDVRELRDLAGKAAGNGMSRLQALQSITLAPAKILGVDKRLGSIEAGKDATFVLADGDILETTPRVLRAWGEGVEIPLADRQKELYQKYRSRPRPPAP